MSSAREAIEKRLLDEGLAALDDPEVARAIAVDDELRALVLALRAVDETLAALPPAEPAPGLVERTLARVRADAASATEVAAADAPAAVAVAEPATGGPSASSPSKRPAPPGSSRAPRRERLGLGDLFGTFVVTVVEGLRRPRPVLVMLLAALVLLPVLTLSLLLTRGSDRPEEESQVVYAAGGDATASRSSTGYESGPFHSSTDDGEDREGLRWAGGGGGEFAPPASEPAAPPPLVSSRDANRAGENANQYWEEEPRRRQRRIEGVAGRSPSGADVPPEVVSQIDIPLSAEDDEAGTIHAYQRERARERSLREQDAADVPPDRYSQLDMSQPLSDQLREHRGRDRASREEVSETPPAGPGVGVDALAVEPAEQQGQVGWDSRGFAALVEQGNERFEQAQDIELELARQQSEPVEAAGGMAGTPVTGVTGGGMGTGAGTYRPLGDDLQGDLPDQPVNLTPRTPADLGLRGPPQHEDLGRYLSASDRALARGWLGARDLVDGLGFVEARGYWANTYVPGDPLLRGLQQRLRRLDEASGGSRSGLALARGASPVNQPFDVPDGAALGVYLQSDRAAVDGETRVLLQVGLQATERRAGRRPAMNVAVVLDLRKSLGPSEAAAVRALLEALAEARDVGDRFSLIVASDEARLVIEPGDLRYGTVQVVARELLEEAVQRGPAPGAARSGVLLDACVEALTTVLENDDPTAPLGSSLVLLVTPGGLGDDSDSDALEAFAHGSAVEGVPVSVVGVGGGASVEELDRIALAGQGNRRLLVEAGMAEDLVDRELAAAGRAVARAVRLRIRLAPGVRLVDVVGSYRLDEVAADRVREAERAVDVRLAQALGIQADRGEDEAGIQIVIPAFYAGDSHTILLDLVVPGAGPVADVTVRYKDLVYLRNAIAADQLSLQRGESPRGPLERNVLENLLAWDLSDVLARAGDLASAGDFDGAARELEGFASLLRGLRSELPGFSTDPGLEADLEMLERYVQALGPRPLGSDELGQSLLYASFLKRLEPPAAEAE